MSKQENSLLHQMVRWLAKRKQHNPARGFIMFNYHESKNVAVNKRTCQSRFGHGRTSTFVENPCADVAKPEVFLHLLCRKWAPTFGKVPVTTSLFGLKQAGTCAPPNLSRPVWEQLSRVSVGKKVNKKAEYKDEWNIKGIKGLKCIFGPEAFTSPET